MINGRGRPLVYRRFTLPSGVNPERMTTKQVAQGLGCSRIWVQIMRKRGDGPAYTQIGPRTIRYKKVDVEKWLRGRNRQEL
jgi:predicted DNA-binding transcriptional regulator AlpA